MLFGLLLALGTACDLLQPKEIAAVQGEAPTATKPSNSREGALEVRRCFFSLPKFDQSVAALVSDLYDRGQQDNVLVVAFGEFGRTPRINKDAGRDHFPGAMSILYAGGGLKMGQAIGTTNATAEYPTSKPYTPGCVLSTMYHVLGVDHHHAFFDQAQRPMPILAEGEPIRELIG